MKKIASEKSPSYLKLKNGPSLAYHKTKAKENTKPEFIFLTGFKSNMEGAKALFLEEWCSSLGCGFIRFDYSGHGKSSGDFLDGSIGSWLEDTTNIINELTNKPQILVGSSLGAWLAMLYTIKFAKNVRSLILIAPAPDFTEDLVWNALKPEEQKIIIEKGVYNLPTEYCNDPSQKPELYPITKKLIEEARSHLLLKTPINIDCPIQIIHGTNDKDVPLQRSIQLMQNLCSSNVTLTIGKNGDHRMSSPEMLLLLEQASNHAIKNPNT